MFSPSRPYLTPAAPCASATLSRGSGEFHMRANEQSQAQLIETLET
jgi:hypothetical protein